MHVEDKKKATAEKALSDYAVAESLHAYEPSFPINRAILLSYLGRIDEAEEAYARGILLQGGMESGFQGRFSLARHQLNQGRRELYAKNPENALASFNMAVNEIEQAIKEMHRPSSDVLALQIRIYEHLGATYEIINDNEAAMRNYDHASSFRKGHHAHLRAAILLGKIAHQTWMRREPSKALSQFMEAKRRVGQARGALPEGITAQQRDAYIVYLDGMIKFLTGAKVKPAR
jgi:tetratricopeptide (TPR) repeat protein